MTRAQFDRSEVIDKAIALFWENGFSASSMKQVVKVTGLKPGSLYLAFGNKEGLFRESLESYGDSYIKSLRHILDNAPSVGEGICTILETAIQDSTKHNYCSCFLIKTQLELTAEEEELCECASNKLKEIEALYQSYLEKEFGSVVGQSHAVSLMLHIFGMRVYGYKEGAAELLRQGLQEGLPWLPWRQKD